MVERIAEVVVLAEDVNQANFARRFLIRAGQDKRKIRVRPLRSGRGSAEQYVRETYPVEVLYYRRRSSSRSAALVVALDADNGSVAGHEAELARSLRHAGESPRQPDEQIALVIPKRNIETWIRCLLGNVVDEMSDYKGWPEIQEGIKPAAQAFFDWSRDGF